MSYEDELGALGPLLMAGELTKLLKRMLRLWPPERPWPDEDAVGYVTELLRVARATHGERALPLYRAYERRLKDPSANYAWLRSIPIRSQIVEAYEGPQRAIAWLEQAAKVIPRPNDGITELLIGQILLGQDDAAAARTHLRAAVYQSLSGIAWYRLEALNSMTSCLSRLGEHRLAFEYMRTHAIDSYKLGRIEEADLHKALYGGALLFGEVDYVVEIKKNMAARSRAAGDFTRAAVHQSDAGFRLGQLGAREEAASALVLASNDAARGRHPNDRQFSVFCFLLARYLRRDPLTQEELLELVEPFAQARIERALHGPAAAILVEEWQRIRRPGTDWKVVLSAAHVLALAARSCLERGLRDEAHMVFEALLSGERSKDAIYLFVAEDYVTSLLAQRQFARAEQVAQTELTKMPSASAHERFGMRQAAARASLGRGDRRTAHRTAETALLEWSRVLGGLYQEAHKIAWLKRGAPCIDCAIASLREPADWIVEHDRHRALFRLIELGKARLTTDLVSHSGRLPGVYLVPEIHDRGGMDPERSLTFGHPDLWPVVMLQLASFADGIGTVFHEDDGRTVSYMQRDVSALRGVIHIPAGPEKQLYATAQALRFDETDPAPRDDVEADIARTART